MRSVAYCLVRCGFGCQFERARVHETFEQSKRSFWVSFQPSKAFEEHLNIWTFEYLLLFEAMPDILFFSKVRMFSPVFRAPYNASFPRMRTLRLCAWDPLLLCWTCALTAFGLFSAACWFTDHCVWLTAHLPYGEFNVGAVNSESSSALSWGRIRSTSWDTILQ